MALNMHRWQFVLAWQFAALTLSVVTSHFIIYLKKFSRWIFRKRLSSRVIFTLVFAHIERVYLKIATKKNELERQDKLSQNHLIHLITWCLFACLCISVYSISFYFDDLPRNAKMNEHRFRVQQRANDESFLMALDCYFITYYKFALSILTTYWRRRQTREFGYYT